MKCSLADLNKNENFVRNARQVPVYAQTIRFGHDFVIIIVVILNYPEETTLCCKLRAVMTCFVAPQSHHDQRTKKWHLVSKWDHANTRFQLNKQLFRQWKMSSFNVVLEKNENPTTVCFLQNRQFDQGLAGLFLCQPIDSQSDLWSLLIGFSVDFDFSFVNTIFFIPLSFNPPPPTPTFTDVMSQQQTNIMPDCLIAQMELSFQFFKQDK